MIADLAGKGSQVRTMPIPEWAKATVDAWTDAANMTHGTVFRAINKAGRVWGDGMSPQVLWRAAAARAGIDKLGPHDLRRTCARLFHMADGELDQIQQKTNLARRYHQDPANAMLHSRASTRSLCMSERSESPQPPQARLAQMATGFILSRLVYTAASLGIADRLAGSPKSAGELATPTGCDADSLGRFMRTLTNFGILTLGDDGRFSLTSLGEPLRSDVPGSVHSSILTMGGQWNWKT